MEKDMTSGSPLKLIFWFSIPVLLGNIFQQFYNMMQLLSDDCSARMPLPQSVQPVLLCFWFSTLQSVLHRDLVL